MEMNSSKYIFLSNFLSNCKLLPSAYSSCRYVADITAETARDVHVQLKYNLPNCSTFLKRISH